MRRNIFIGVVIAIIIGASLGAFYLLPEEDSPKNSSPQENTYGFRSSPKETMIEFTKRAENNNGTGCVKLTDFKFYDDIPEFNITVLKDNFTRGISNGRLEVKHEFIDEVVYEENLTSENKSAVNKMEQYIESNTSFTIDKICHLKGKFKMNDWDLNYFIMFKSNSMWYVGFFSLYLMLPIP